MTDTGVDHFQGEPCGTGEHVDRSAARQIVHHHLPGHLLWIGRDPFSGDAVIGGEHQEVRLYDAWCARTLNQAELNCNNLQLPKRAWRFGLGIDAGGQLLLQARIGDRGNIEYIIG